MKIDITIAKTAGMCYGVKRALKITEAAAIKFGKIYVLGDLINNPDEMKRLKNLGVIPIDDIRDLPSDEKRIIIRSHGVGNDIYNYLEEHGIEPIDATCPDVKKIHKIAAEKSNQGEIILIAGDKNHPEVRGIIGHCVDKNKVFVLEDEEAVTLWLQNGKKSCENLLNFISQTTFDSRKWNNCKKIIEKHYTKAYFFDTICRATLKRQEEAEKIALCCDVMLVLGGQNSSNSKKLADICKEKVKTFFIENASFLEMDKILNSALSSDKKILKIGITAGASTPAYIIKEVHCIMSEEVKKGSSANVEMTEGDLDFLAEINKTFKRIYIGNRVKAYVVSVNKTEAVVDVGTKHSGYIPADELTSDPTKLPPDIVSVGDEIDCLVTSINDAEGVVYLSKKKVDAALGIEKINTAYENGEMLDGMVTAVVKGGVIVLSEGARIFVPASQSGVPRSGKLEDLLKKPTKIKIIEVNEARGRVVGSIRAAKKEINDLKKQKFWDEIAEGQKFVGEVKSIESYGVFVDLGGVDGMVHLTELTWNRIKHPKDIVSAGDTLNVYIKSFDKEKKRISLGAKDPNDNPWEKFKNEYNVGDVINAQIVSITPFGAFAQIIPGVDGLIHISQISLERVANVAQVLSVGQMVDVKITEIEIEKNRISLSIKALLETHSEEDDGETPEFAYSDDSN